MTSPRSLVLLVLILVLFGCDRTGKAVEPEPFACRRGEAKIQLLKEFGGTAESERAVALGLAWLAKEQKADGGWEFDAGTFKQNRVAATGLALLAFLGAGETHTAAKGKYAAVVKRGVAWLVKAMTAEGASAGRLSTNMYEQAIGTVALCEAYGMTREATLKKPAQLAINYVQKAQGSNGSWGYNSGTDGDTSITGWQVQALLAAKVSKIDVDNQVVKKAVKFLDSVAAGEWKSMYGYANKDGAAPGTALTAEALLCRHYIDGWGPNHPGIVDGVAGLMKHPPAGKGGLSNLYYYYYATQLMRNYAGDDWRTWNEGRKGGMRDWLVNSQVRKDGPTLGSWEPESGWFGHLACGRLGTTAVCVLTLEVYYRYPLLYRRGVEGRPEAPGRRVGEGGGSPAPR